MSVPWGMWGAGGTAVLRPPGSKGQSLCPSRISRSLEWSWRHEGAQLSARTGLVSRMLCLGGWLAVTGSPKPGFLLPSSLGNQGGPARLGTSEPGSGCVVEPCPRLVGTLGGCALSGSPGSPVSREGGGAVPRGFCSPLFCKHQLPSATRGPPRASAQRTWEGQCPGPSRQEELGTLAGALPSPQAPLCPPGLGCHKVQLLLLNRTWGQVTTWAQGQAGLQAEEEGAGRPGAGRGAQRRGGPDFDKRQRGEALAHSVTTRSRQRVS